jgi:transposase InsO family protein
MTCNPPSSNGHKYIIVAVDYFTKWAKSMLTFNNTANTTAHFFFNHIISHFGVPLQLVSNQGKHFENEIFVELSSQLGFSHDFASPYYPPSNGQVEAVNKFLKTMLQCMVNKNKNNWHHMLFFVLWAYRTAVKMTTGFTPFHLVHGVKATLPIECEIPTLCTTIELLPETAPMEQHLLNLESLDEDRQSSLQNNQAAKKWSKATFDHHVNLCSFHEGNLFLAYDIAHDTLYHGKLESLWHGPYIIQHCLTKGAYIVAYPKGLSLKDPINGLYLKKFYA